MTSLLLPPGCVVLGKEAQKESRLHLEQEVNGMSGEEDEAKGLCRWKLMKQWKSLGA